MDSFCQCTDILTSHLPSSNLINILLDEKKMKSVLTPRLVLSDDPDENIRAYYSIMHVSTIIMGDFLIVILSRSHRQVPLNRYLHAL